MDEDHGRWKTAAGSWFRLGAIIRSAKMSFEDYATIYQGKWKDLSDVLKAVVDSGEVHKIRERSGPRGE